MKLSLTSEQTNKAVREFLADPSEEDQAEGLVAVRLPESTPMRVTTSRDGGLTVYTGTDAAYRLKAEKTPLPKL